MPNAGSPSNSYCQFRGVAFSDRHAFVGVVAPDVQRGDDAYRDCSLGRMAADHIGYFRYDMDWKAVELRPGSFDFGFYDQLVTKLALHHISYLPILGNGPDFRTLAPMHGARPGWYPPRNASDFARFAALAAQRYGPGGAFWRSNPTLPQYPVRAWQIWNEPALTYFWEPAADPAAYTRLLRAAHDAIKRVDPTAEIVTAGIPWFQSRPFYKAMFRHGALGSFDALAFHAYAPTGRMSYLRTAALRRLMNRYGARKLPIWVTEFGWSADGPPSPYRAGKLQGQQIGRFLQYVARHRRRLRIQAVFYYDWRDPPPVKPAFDYWGFHTGLYTSSGRPRPSVAVMSAAAARLNR